uniref:Ubiquitin specific peptidase 48 n=1 Tax=Oncorhynchus kisutch TaxID=8019 RepID=A0A8C7KXZ0_ONCKI
MFTECKIVSSENSVGLMKKIKEILAYFYEFVPLEWLKKWLDDSTVTKEIDNGNFLCSHGKLHPDKVGEAKRISVKAAELLFDKYGGGPRLDGSTLCEECVGQRCRVLRLKNQLAEDYKEVTNLVKCPPKSDEGYWAGKTSLRSWRQLALEQLEEDEEETKHSNGKTNGEGPEITNLDGDEEEMKTFNEDILCRHGGLSILESERRLVTEEVWSKLRVYFPKAPQFTQLQEPCQQCLRLEREGKENEALNRMMASEQKSSLLNLFQEKNRPTLTKWPQETDILYIVPLFFVDEWRRFIRRPTKTTPVSSVGNSLLLCPHRGFMFTFDSMLKGDAQHIALLWPDEWEVISRHFLVDQPISICRISGATPNGSSVEYTTQPELCRDCREGFIFQQQRDMREYAQATVYVRKVIDDKRLKDAAPEMNVSGSEAEDEREEPVAKVDGERDPDFSQIMHAFSVAPFDQNLSIDGRCLTDDSATLGSLGVIPESVICLKADEPIADFAAMDDVYQVCMPEEGFKGKDIF